MQSNNTAYIYMNWCSNPNQPKQLNEALLSTLLSCPLFILIIIVGTWSQIHVITVYTHETNQLDNWKNSIDSKNLVIPSASSDNNT